MLGKIHEHQKADNVKHTLVNNKVSALLLHSLVKRLRPIMTIGNGMEQSDWSAEQFYLNTPTGNGTANQNDTANETEQAFHHRLTVAMSSAGL